jgi:hypothetical protein
MDTNILVAAISAGASTATGIFGMWITSSGVGKRIDELSTQTGKRIDDMGNRFGDLVHRFDDLRTDFKDLRSEVKDLRLQLTAFKEVVNGKFRDLDLDLAKLMDRPK